MPSGVKAHLGLGKEAAWGTPVAAAAYIPLVSENLGPEIEQIQDQGLRGNFAAPDQYQGLITVGGEIVFDGRPSLLGHVLRGVLGAPTTTGTGPYTHEFVPAAADFAADCPLPPYTLEVFRDLAQAQQYAGCVFNSLRLEWGTAQKTLRCTLGLIGRSKPANIAATTPSYEVSEPFLWRQCTLKLGDDLAGAAQVNNLESFGLTIANGLEGVFTLNNTQEISRIRRQTWRVVDFQATFDLENLDEYNKFLAGTPRAWDMTFTVDANTSLQIQLPKCIYEAYPVNVGGPGRLQVQATGKAKYHSTETFDVKVILKNSTASY